MSYSSSTHGEHRGDNKSLQHQLGPHYRIGTYDDGSSQTFSRTSVLSVGRDVDGRFLHVPRRFKTVSDA